MSTLGGRQICGARVSADGRFVAFHADRYCIETPAVLWIIKGDCCSQAWIYHVSGADALPDGDGTDILDVEIPSPSADGQSIRHINGDRLQRYVARVRTPLGTVSFEMRQFGNGEYYGGEIGEIADPATIEAALQEDRVEIEWRPLAALEP